ncbi:MAG: SH3 domain-containing protein [Bacteroidetes bacterium]|nr:SH3 domain-containing protein [Bacteroidota bacterium]
MTNGTGGIKDTINLTYPSSGGTKTESIVVKMAIEGYPELVKRQSKYATIISSVLAVLMLLYIFSNYDFSGWAIFGFVISAIAIGWAASLAIQNEKEMGGLVIGGIILLITNWIIFALLSTVIITFYVAKLVFRKNPFRNEFIAAIPIGSFVLFLLLFFGASNLRYSNYNNPRNNNNVNTQQTTYQPTTSINRYAYIKADPIGNIRNSPYIEDNNVITSLNKGEQVYIIEQDKATNWYKVRYANGQIGYASNKIIDFNYVTPNKNNIISSSNSTNTSTTTKRLSSSLFLGNWSIDNGRSKYKFYKNYTGEYINSRGKLISFRWSYSNNYLKIILNTDNSVWDWKINSFSENRINMYSSKNKTYRTITKP